MLGGAPRYRGILELTVRPGDTDQTPSDGHRPSDVFAATLVIPVRWWLRATERRLLVSSANLSNFASQDFVGAVSICRDFRSGLGKNWSSVASSTAPHLFRRWRWKCSCDASTPSPQRSTASVRHFEIWAGDATDFPREIAEEALVNKVGDNTELAYRRGDAIEKRRALMEAWCAFCGAAYGD